MASYDLHIILMRSSEMHNMLIECGILGLWEACNVAGSNWTKLGGEGPRVGQNASRGLI